MGDAHKSVAKECDGYIDNAGCRVRLKALWVDSRKTSMRKKRTVEKFLADLAPESIATLGDLLEKTDLTEAVLATAIERHGVSVWDKFNRFFRADEAGKERALRLLFLRTEWRKNAHELYEQDPLQVDETDNPYFHFGWPAAKCPNFEALKLAVNRGGGLESKKDLTIRLRKSIAEERSKGTKAFNKVVAANEGFSVSRLKQLTTSKKPEQKSPSGTAIRYAQLMKAKKTV